VLRIYCRGLQRQGVEDLRASLRTGRYPWLHEELAAAITNPDIGLAWWIDAIGDFAVINSNRVTHPVRARQKQLWRALFPGHPWPVLTSDVA
jgi:hypothetical protein